VFGDIGRGAAVLAAEREALDQTQADKRHRSDHANAVIRRQQAHRERGETHQQHGDEEGVLAPPLVAEAAEDQRPKRAHRETSGEGEQREDVARRLVHAGEEVLGDEAGERAVEVEIVPLENGADRCAGDHQNVVAIDLMRCCARARHAAPPPKVGGTVAENRALHNSAVRRRRGASRRA
jgi:hypothetical protein